MYQYILRRFNAGRYTFGPGCIVVPTELESQVTDWKTTGRSRDATTDETNAYVAAHVVPPTLTSRVTALENSTATSDALAIVTAAAAAAQSTADAIKAGAATDADTLLEVVGKINSAVSTLKGSADTSGDTLGELEALVATAKAEADAIIAGTSGSNDTLIEVFNSIATQITSATGTLKGSATAAGDTLGELEARIAALESTPAGFSWNDVIWGSTYDTLGGTSFTGVGTKSLSKTNNDSTFRTGGFGSVQLTDEGIVRHICGYTPSDSSPAGSGSVGFGLSHSNAMSPNGIFYMDVDYAVILTGSPELRVGGTQVATFTAAKGDVFELRVYKDSLDVRWVAFYKNDALVYKSTVAPTMNLYIASVVYHQNRVIACKYSTSLVN